MGRHKKLTKAGIRTWTITQIDKIFDNCKQILSSSDQFWQFWSISKEFNLFLTNLNHFEQSNPIQKVCSILAKLTPILISWLQFGQSWPILGKFESIFTKSFIFSTSIAILKLETLVENCFVVIVTVIHIPNGDVLIWRTMWFATMMMIYLQDS